MSTESRRGLVNIPTLDFRYKASYSHDFGTVGYRYEPPLDNKKVPVAIHVMSQWRFHDVKVTKDRILQIMLIFKFSPKILGICDLDVFLPIINIDDHHNIHKTFQVQTSIFLG